MRNTITAAIGPLSYLTQYLLCSFSQDLKLPSDHRRNCSNTFGIAPHSDYGLITLVAQEKVSGLQVRTPCGTHWIDVKPIPGSLVLNTADSLTRVTNGRLLSTLTASLTQQKKSTTCYFFSVSYIGCPTKTA